MKAIHLKALRDLWLMRGQALAIALVIASGIAIVAVWATISLIESLAPGFKVLHDNTSMILLFLIIIVLGICITLFSTHRSVIKYLRMKLDDLY